MLEELGYRVRKASSGRDALILLEHEPVDLVITDYAMPFMSGLNLAAEISKHWPALPVILVSGYVERHALTRHDIPFLSKPFSLARIDALITDVLQTPQGSLARP
ncbi:response regulator [Pseudomonas silvicola]|nr:response regulator [Pseudomonas silvicola]